jgi:hypothetical protein
MSYIQDSPSPPFDWKEIDSLKKEIWNGMFHAGVWGMIAIGILMSLPLPDDGKLATLEGMGLIGILLAFYQIFAFFVLLIGREFWQEKVRKMIQNGTYTVPRKLSELILYGTPKGRIIWRIFSNDPGGLDDFFLFNFSRRCFQAQYIAIIKPERLEIHLT